MLAGLLSIFCPVILSARNAPVTTAGSSTACPGATVVVPITVTGFVSIKAITLRLDFDPTLLTFVSFTNLNSSISGASVNTVNISPTLSKVMIVWADLNALSLTDGSKLADLNFTFLAGAPVILFNNTADSGGDCEYADENGNPMNDMPTASYYFNSTITNNAIGAAGTITGSNILCAGTNNVPYSVPVITNATGYTWTVPTGGSIISGNNTHAIVVNYSLSAVSGTITVKGTNSCGQGTPSSLAVTVNPMSVPVITGAAAVCASSSGNIYSTTTGMTSYVWTVSAGGSITSGAGTSSITVTWNTPGTQNVSVIYNTTAGCTVSSPTVKTVVVNPLPVPTIGGNGSVCAGSTNVDYATEASMTGYTWNISTGGSITFGGNTNVILVTWSLPGPQWVTVNYAIPSSGCQAIAPALKAVTVNSLPVPTISGPVAVCNGSTGNVYSTETGMSGYIWTVSGGGSITAGGGSGNNTVTVTWNSTGPQTVSVNYTVPATNCTAQNPTTKSVTVNALPVPTISGPAAACSGIPGNVYTTETGMTGYTWTVSSGGSITSGGGTANSSVTITWNSPPTQTVSCNYSNSFGCAAAASTPKTVTVNSLPVPTITGPGPVCTGSAGNIYTTESGMTGYSWTVSGGGSITAGGGSASNTVTVTWNTPGVQSVGVNYTAPSGCTALSQSVTNVTVNPLPVPTITGLASVCEASSGITYSTEPGMTNYQWTITPGGMITSGTGTNSIVVTWNTAGAQSLSVNYTNSNGCSAINPTTKNITVAPFPGTAGLITGSASVCSGSNGIAYSTTVIANASSYNWVMPSGATISAGSGTNSIIVNFSAIAASGNITVNGTNSCGNGVTSPDFPVAVFQMPGAAGSITGPPVVCAGTNNVIFTTPVIANAVTYDWTLPAGAVITSGGNTNQIVVSFSATPGTGVITVKGTNVCGSGTVSPSFTVTMIASQAAPVVTVAGALLTSTTVTGNQWFYEGTGAIPGATGQTYVATITGWYWSVVEGTGCPYLESNHVYVLFVGQEEMLGKSLSVYPVPNNGKFNVLLNDLPAGNYTLLVFNQVGARVYESDDIRLQGNIQKTIDIRPASTGIYSVVLLSKDHAMVRKVLVR